MNSRKRTQGTQNRSFFSASYLQLGKVCILLWPCLVLQGMGDSTNIVADLEEDHALPMEFETPHTDWATPYAQGTLRVLYFGYGGSGRGIEARDFVELMQRFDIEGEAAFFQQISDEIAYNWAGGPPGIERIDKLLSQEWDCYLFNGVSPDLMPSYRFIRDKFTPMYYGEEPPAEDARKPGIVFIGADDPFLTAEENRVEGPSPVSDGDAFETPYGRAVRLAQRPKIPLHPGWEADYDYWMEQVGRTVLWAAGKEPTFNLEVGLQESESLRIRMIGSPVGEDVNITARLRGSRANVIPLTLAASESEPGTYTAMLPPTLAADTYRLDFFAAGSKGAEFWATTPLEIAAPRSVEGVMLERDWGEVGEAITGTVRLKGTELVAEEVEMQLNDAHGRILRKDSIAVADDTAEFTYTVEPWMPMLLEVRAVIRSEGREIASDSRYFRVPKRNREQFNFVAWIAGGAFGSADWPYDTLTPYLNQQLARMGITAQMNGSRSAWRGWPYLPTAAAEISLVPYATRFTEQHDENGHMLPVCWSHESAVNGWVNDVVKQTQGTRQHGALVYSLGDEGVSGGSCIHPACLDAYRTYLETQYGEIGALNASWGTDYAAFSEVALSRPDDNLEEDALHAGNLPRWYDRQAFRAQNLVKLAARHSARFKTVDPQAKAGYEGAGRFADGADIDLICRTLEYWAPYPGLQDEVLRSIAPPGFIMSNWMGYHKSEGDLLGQFWRMVTRGFNSVWFWRWSNLGPYEKKPAYHGLVNAAMVPWDAVKELLADTRIVLDGLGTLLMQSERGHGGIAMLYSFPSQFVIAEGPGTTYGDAEGHEMTPLKDDPDRDGKESLIVYEQNNLAWHRAMRAVGLQFEYVTDGMLRRGEFNADEYKVLILSQIEALGEEEAAVIRQFAEQGGTVIADVRPGLFDGHCKRLEKGALDDLFGIRRTGNTAALVTDARVADATGTFLELSGLRVDPGVEPAAGQPRGDAGGVSLWIENRVGEGAAVLLNFAMDSFPLINTGNAPAGAEDLIRSLFTGAGVEPPVELTDASGNPVRDTEIIAWKGPGVEFLALYGAMDLMGRRMNYIAKDEKVNVALPDARHVYDLRDGAYLGEVDRFETTKLGNRATFLVLSEEALNPPSVDTSGARRGERITVNVSYPESAATHAVRLRVTHPDGTDAEWHDQVLIVPPGGAQANLPIAHNDPPGEWTLTARNLYTQQTTEHRIAIQ